MTDILIVYPAMEYTDSDGNTHYYDIGGITTDASLAALLRAAMNPDPSSFYPLEGSGDYIDNVLQVENKEETDALNVEYVGIIPLISPLVDGSDQTAVIQAAKFLPELPIKMPLGPIITHSKMRQQRISIS